jgi:arabinose-5-phosphate isomerase
LAKNADVVINIACDREADPLNLAPTTSTTLTMAAGDALAAALMVHRGFTVENFGQFHPGGTLGQVTNK